MEKYRVIQQKPDIFRDNILYIKLDRPNRTWLYPYLKGCGENGFGKIWQNKQGINLVKYFMTPKQDMNLVTYLKAP